AFPALHARGGIRGAGAAAPAAAPYPPGPARPQGFPGMSTVRIDFNCDLGEGCGDDGRIVPCISSASIACGGHAGDETTMRIAVERCRRQGVAVGAHPSFVDRDHFGRRELAMEPAAIRLLVTAQTRRL